MTAAIFVGGVLAILVAGHIAFRPAPFWRACIETLAALALIYVGVSLLRLHDRVTADDPPPPPVKKWERAI